ncbi:HAD-superfamily hydrolase, subfamily IA, variant 3 [Asticcacaulis excentricus CB 48]|uniref:HAD-superfamily hydrolase, subfamily IA, variant 3 n=2 Tax=Asticcacaulis excentricus TaxID=78587 RepID=E8RUE5_ASTEC|nr:HAD-superfamily hydrolase, subfamily IA, variant 3 [Asticcacaulis excentricus CB 48]
MFADSLHPPAHAKALIFDCDGTLADTFAAHYGAFRAALAPYGIDFGTDFYAVRLGWSRKALLEAVVQETGVPFDAEAVAARNAPLFLDHIDAVRAIAATEALVRGYYGKMRLGVCSGGQKDIVEATLKAIGLYDCFDGVVTFEDTGIGKPAPDLYLEACRRVGVAPSEAHAYEDSDEGIEAARVAGLSVSDVRPFYTPDPSGWCDG